MQPVTWTFSIGVSAPQRSSTVVRVLQFKIDESKISKKVNVRTNLFKFKIHLRLGCCNMGKLYQTSYTTELLTSRWFRDAGGFDSSLSMFDTFLTSYIISSRRSCRLQSFVGIWLTFVRHHRAVDPSMPGRVSTLIVIHSYSPSRTLTWIMETRRWMLLDMPHLPSAAAVWFVRAVLFSVLSFTVQVESLIRATATATARVIQQIVFVFFSAS